MGPTPILEMARAYGLRPRLWLLVTSRADSKWVDKSWRRQKNSKEKIGYSCGLVENQSFVLYLKVFKTDLYLSSNT